MNDQDNRYSVYPLGAFQPAQETRKIEKPAPPPKTETVFRRTDASFTTPTTPKRELVLYNLSL